MKMKIAFIGIGDMGLEMVPHLVKGQHDVTIWDRNSENLAKIIDPEIKIAKSLAEAVENAELVITSVMAVDVDDLHLGVEGNQGIIEHLKPGSTLVVTSTLNPEKIFAIRDALPAEVNLLDVPVIGGVKYAREAKLTLLAGGDRDVVERFTPVLNLFGTTKYVGKLGDGAKLKLITNVSIMAAEAGLRETLDLADQYEIDYGLVLELIQMGPLKPVIVRALDETNPRPLEKSVDDMDELLAATEPLIDLPMVEAARTRLRKAVDDAGGTAKFIDITNKVTALPRFKNR